MEEAGHPGAKYEEALAFGAQPGAHTPESRCPLGFVCWWLASRSLVLAMFKQHTFLPVSEHRSTWPCLLEARRWGAGCCLGPASGRGPVPGLARPLLVQAGTSCLSAPWDPRACLGPWNRGFLSLGIPFPP